MVVSKLLRNTLKLLAFAPLVGCASFQDAHYEHSQKLRTECAFLHYRWTSGESIGYDYAKGWKAGYLDVLTGGDGQPPLIPPRCYWSPSQITKHCDEKRQEWYVGFQDGAMMASLEPETHYIKAWTPPATAHTGYYEAVEMPAHPPQVPPSEPFSPEGGNWGATSPNQSPKPNTNLPPIPAEPERLPQ